MHKKRILYSLKWGSVIGISTGIITILGFFISFLKPFDFPQLGASFYLLKIVPMFFVVAFFKDNNTILNTFLTGFFVSVFISFFSEITIHGYFLITAPKHSVVFWILYHNICMLTIASTIIAFILYKYGNQKFLKQNQIQENSDILDD